MKKEKNVGRKERPPGTMAGPTCRVQPWPELGDVWALEGMAQGVAFDDTLGVSRLDRS